MRHCLGGRKNKECCDMFKYRCWTQKALNIFLQILSWRSPSGSLSVPLLFYTPLGEFQLFLVTCPKGPPSPWPFFPFPVSEPSALALITNRESPGAAAVQQPGEQQVQIAEEWGRVQVRDSRGRDDTDYLLRSPRLA